jgi:hypothetical protein
MHDGMIRDKQYGIENDGLVIFRNLGFSFSRTERDGCLGGIEVYIAGPHLEGAGAGAGGCGPSLKMISFR